MDITFGQFVRSKRIEKDFTLRGFAAKLSLSPVYMSNIETDRRPAPAQETLDKMISLLLLDKDETTTLYDLAARSRENSVSSDLPEYIMEKDIVRAALRTAKEVDATDAEWQEFIDRITKRGNSNGG